MQVQRYLDYRDFLKSVLESRIQRNSRYSLRAFARDLDVAPQILSSVFKRKKGISAEMATKIAVKLDLGREETHYLCDLVDMAHARTERTRKIAEARLSRYRAETIYRPLSEDIFRAISDWYHYAILELTYVEDFRSSSAWIAKQLRISAHEAQQAVDRLKRLGMLVTEGTRLRKAESGVTTTHEIPSEAIRAFNRQILAKAADALTFQGLEERDCTTMTMAVDPGKIPEAKEKIRAFRRELTGFMESGRRAEVYCMAIQLFRLSERKEGKGK